MVTIPQYTTVKGCAIYRLDANGKPVSKEPAAMDIDITIGEQSHPSTDISMMGTVSVPDQTRLDNFTITANINCDASEAAALNGPGLIGWEIKWVDEVVDPSGLPDVIGWTVTAYGYIASTPEAMKNAGSENKGDITMNVVSFQKQNSKNEIVCDIDRSQNRLIRNGVDYREKVNQLLSH